VRKMINIPVAIPKRKLRSAETTSIRARTSAFLGDWPLIPGFLVSADQVTGTVSAAATSAIKLTTPTL
jgi:hypothetical protein